MTTVRLRALQGAKEIASFRRDPGGLVALERAADEDVRRDLQRWLDNGFTEFVGPRGNRQPLTTRPTDPDLLGRIAEYLRRHGFDIRLDVEDGVVSAEELLALIRGAPSPTPEQLEEQRFDFAYGNLAVSTTTSRRGRRSNRWRRIEAGRWGSSTNGLKARSGFRELHQVRSALYVTSPLPKKKHN